MAVDPNDYAIGSSALGKGSFGEVRVWKHRSSGEVIVCKTSLFDPDSDRDSVFAGILVEWSLGRVLDHPHILRAYGASLSETSAGILYPRAESRDLLQWIQQSETPLDLEKIHVVLVQILDALAYLKRLDIVHGDVKLQNVLLFDDNLPHVQLADFGLAHTVLRNSALQPVPRCAEIQTLWYRPPKLLLHQALGAFYAQYDAAIDIWAFGCLAYECVQREPFVASETAIGTLALIRKHVGWYQDEDAIHRQITCYGKDTAPHTGIHRLFLRYDASRTEPSDRIASIPCPIIRDVVRSALVLEPNERSTAEELLSLLKLKNHTPTLCSVAAYLRGSEHYYCEEEHDALRSISGTQRQRSIQCIAEHCREFREHPLLFFLSMEILDRYQARVQTFDDLLPSAAFHVAQLTHSESSGAESLVGQSLVDHLHRCEARILQTLEYQVFCTTRFHWFVYLLRTLHPSERTLSTAMLALLYTSIDDVDNTLLNNPKEIALNCIRTARINQDGDPADDQGHVPTETESSSIKTSSVD